MSGAGGRLPSSLLLVGAGRMGSALLDGWLAIGLPPARVLALDPALPEPARDALAAKGVSLVASADALPPVEALVLAVKPQTLDEAAPALSPLVTPRTLVLSVLAGKTVADLSARLGPDARIVRAMPNTPAAVRRGVTAAFAGPGVDERTRDAADRLLSAVGRVEWLDDEDLIDAVTAVSGSGPAYVFHLVEALAEAGSRAGLPADLAGRLARATVEGAGELLYRSDEPAAALREAVTSKGGTTAAALDVLRAPANETAGRDGATGATGAMTDLVSRAVAAAKARARALSG